MGFGIHERQDEEEEKERHGEYVGAHESFVSTRTLESTGFESVDTPKLRDVYTNCRNSVLSDSPRLPHKCFMAN